MDNIKLHRRKVDALGLENVFELDTNCHEQKLLATIENAHRKSNKRKAELQGQKRLKQLNTKIRQEYAKRTKINTWGVHNHIIELKIKIRMTEELIECAQRLEVMPDAKTEKEMQVLKALRDQTYEDLQYFINEREKKLWRNWHVSGVFYKPIIPSGELTLQHAESLIREVLAYIQMLELKAS